MDPAATAAAPAPLSSVTASSAIGLDSSADYNYSRTGNQQSATSCTAAAAIQADSKACTRPTRAPNKGYLEGVAVSWAAGAKRATGTCYRMPSAAAGAASRAPSTRPVAGRPKCGTEVTTDTPAKAASARN